MPYKGRFTKKAIKKGRRIIGWKLKLGGAAALGTATWGHGFISGRSFALGLAKDKQNKRELRKLHRKIDNMNKRKKR